MNHKDYGSIGARVRRIAWAFLVSVILACVIAALNAVPPPQITITPANPSIQVGNTVQLTALSNGVPTTAVWTSGTPAVATVSATGLVMGVSVGSSVITARVGNKKAMTTVTVTSSLTMTWLAANGPAEVAVGNTAQYTSTATYSDGSTQDVTSGTSWSVSSLGGGATIASGGLLTATSVGQVKVRADYGGQTAYVYVMVVAPPPPSGARGPLPEITCPAGSVNISPGTNIQTVVNNSSNGTAFCLLSAGVHNITYQISPKPGQSFTCEYGAILDGSSWARIPGVYDQYAIRAVDSTRSDVAVRNCTIRNMPRVAVSGGVAYRWTIDHNDIYGNYRAGVEPSHDGTVSSNLIHGNVGDVNSAIHAENGGGYLAVRVANVQFLNNELYGNGPEQKAFHASGVAWRGNYSHHNLYHGIWLDGDNPNSVVEDNIVEDEAIFGIFVELSQQVTVRRNTVRRSGWNGIALTTSREVQVYENVIEDAGRWGIQLRVDCPNLGGGELALKWDLTNNTISDNTILVATVPGAGASSLVTANCTVDQTNQYQSNQKNNQFVGNDYAVPSLSGAYWWWVVAEFIGWSQWQGIGQDTAGTITLR